MPAVQVGPRIRLPPIMVSTSKAHAQQVVVLLPGNLNFQSVLENNFAELVAVSKGRLQEDSVMIERDKFLCIPMNDTDYFEAIKYS